MTAVSHIAFQDKYHRGHASYAFVLFDKNQEAIFKVFLGCDENGEIYLDQLEQFNHIRDQLSVRGK